MNKVIATTWRTSGSGCVGFVLSRTSHDGKLRAYVGVSRDIDPQADAQYIADFGARMSLKEALAYFSGIDPREYSEQNV